MSAAFLIFANKGCKTKGGCFKIVFSTLFNIASSAPPLRFHCLSEDAGIESNAGILEQGTE
jgi:hypothetical protein